MKGQISLEQMVVTALGLAFVAIMFSYAFVFSLDTLNVAQARDTVDKIAKNADIISTLGGGAKLSIEVMIPSNVVNTSISGNRALLTVRNSGGDRDIFAFSKNQMTGSITRNSGKQLITLTTNDNGIVSVNSTGSGVIETPPIIDTTPPIIFISPANGSTWNSSNTVTFQYNVTDDSSIANCSLIINGAINQTDDVVTKGVTQTFTQTLANGTYTWSVNCTDTLLNKGASATYQLTVSYKVFYPATTLAFFLSSDSMRATSGGGSDSGDFAESPIQLNDYGNTSKKVATWNCTDWTSAGANDVGARCSGGWSCIRWDNNSCAEYKCTSWTTGAVQTTNYCAGGWNCTSWNNSQCSNWSCITPTNTPTQKDVYCTGGWNCTSWTNNSCANWKCINNTINGSSDRDYYCSGTWDCLNFNSNQCGLWNCSAFSMNTADDTDTYCADGYNCASWNGSVCSKWACLTPTTGASQRDMYCNAWNCTSWDESKKACGSWSCLNWITGSARKNYYCSGTINATSWKSFG